jgi:hypothetical protein
MQLKPAVERVTVHSGPWYPSERVSYPDLTIRDAVRAKDSPGEDAHPATPDPGLDEITGNVVGEHAFQAVLDIVKPGQAHHGVGHAGHVRTVLAASGVILALSGPADGRVPVDHIGEDPFHQI